MKTISPTITETEALVLANLINSSIEVCRLEEESLIKWHEGITKDLDRLNNIIEMGGCHPRELEFAEFSKKEASLAIDKYTERLQAVKDRLKMFNELETKWREEVINKLL